jgi:hypothetical protein
MPRRSTPRQLHGSEYVGMIRGVAVDRQLVTPAGRCSIIRVSTQAGSGCVPIDVGSSPAETYLASDRQVTTARQTQQEAG